MRDAICLEQFERRLIELGCPERRLAEKVRELGDHYQDLKVAALEEGCSEGEAEARAAALLGDPVMLAENLVLGMRQASWWGRHPVIGFCLLPPLVVIFVWAGCLGMLVGICRLAGCFLGPAYNIDQTTLSTFQSDPDVFQTYATRLQSGLGVAACLVLTVGFGWLVRRLGAGWKWAVATCGSCLVASQMFWSSIQPHRFTLGLGWHFPWPNLNWLVMPIPLVAAAAAFLYQRKRESRCAPLPRRARRGQPAGPAKTSLLRRWCATPTYWVVMIVVALASWGIAGPLAASRQETARQAELKEKIWPAERAATLALLKSRPPVVAAGRETTINLQPWVNEPLTASTGESGRVTGNDLAGLPAGVHNFAGVPFDVAGRVQLLGKGMTGPHEKLFPAAVRRIAIGRHCVRLHLLQGACNVQTPGATVARLALHYQNGAQAEIGIVSGQDLLDWWGPIYNTDAGIERYTTSPETELAWAGSNPCIQERSPDFSLRLYRSSFANPHPEWEVTSLDYISTVTDAAPFLAGLTVESPAPGTTNTPR